jgi:hypothetical protein
MAPTEAEAAIRNGVEQPYKRQVKGNIKRHDTSSAPSMLACSSTALNNSDAKLGFPRFPGHIK